MDDQKFSFVYLILGWQRTEKIIKINHKCLTYILQYELSVFC